MYIMIITCCEKTIEQADPFDSNPRSRIWSVPSRFTRARWWFPKKIHSTPILWLSKMPWIFRKQDTQQLHFTQQFRKDSLVKLSENYDIMSSFNTAFFCREFNSTVLLPHVFNRDSELLPEGGPPRSSVKYLPAWGI